MHDELLRLFRQVMPGARGVVLATHEGALVASDAPGSEALAREAAASRTAGESVLVRREEGLYLVVFVPGDDASLFKAVGTAAA